MDEFFAGSLVYSASDDSEIDEPFQPPEISQQELENMVDVQANVDINSDESDDDLNKSIRKTKKIAKILSSDDDIENSDNTSPKASKNDLENKNTNIVRASIYDSDTKSSSEESKVQSESNVSKMRKKFKKKKLKPQKNEKKQMSESESELSSDEEDENRSKKRPNKSKTSSGSDSSDSDSSNHISDELNDIKKMKNIKPKQKKIERMSAKIAREQMKEFQSESQRITRDFSTSVPCHKPKQYSLKEFLSRRSIVEQQQKVTSKLNVKAAAAIKMSGDDLNQYMEALKKRAQEAEEFFQDEGEERSKINLSRQTEHENLSNSDENMGESSSMIDTGELTPEKVQGSEEIRKTPTSPSNPTKNTDNPNPDNDIVHQNTPDSMETTRQKSAEVIEFHTTHTELDAELDKMDIPVGKPAKLLSIPTNYVPKLNGDKGLVIDFETNDLKPAPKSGVDELLTRFVKNALIKPKEPEPHDVGIFLTNTGTVERHKFHHLGENKIKKDPKPGESLFKLRTELSLKIKENREKIIAQRIQEYKEQELKQKEIDDENEELDELDELSLSGESATESNIDGVETVNDDGNDVDQNGIDNAEENQDSKDVDDKYNNDDDDDDNDDSEDTNEIESNIQSNIEGQKSRKRILMLENDSDDEDLQLKLSNNDPVGGFQDDRPSQLPENISLDESSKGVSNQDLSALESEILPLNNSLTDTETSKTEHSRFLTGSNEEDDEIIGESQLMALCSGSFATQNLDIQYIPNESTSTQAHVVNDRCNQKIETNEVENSVPRENPSFLSSDDEEPDRDTQNKAKKKKKKITLVYSDNEDEDENENRNKDEDENEDEDGNVEECEAEEEENELELKMDDQESVDDEEDPGEKFVEYDSYENEIPNEIKRKHVRKASEFFENEAELSESDWDSADEDEKGIDQYEAELGDADEFDKNKLRGELERIRLREQIDDDAREIRILTERFIEEEEDDGMRERKFRWKHLNNTDNFDDQPQTIDEETVILRNSDDENEAEWRRIRYEREQLLKQQMAESNSIVEKTTATASITKQITNENTAVVLNSSKRVSIMKPVGTASAKTASPFLITKSGLNMGHLSRKSFLNRDSPILEKLASLSKAANENDSILNTAKGKGNYVFVATEKKDVQNSKRKSESGNEVKGDHDFESVNPSKKSKFDPQQATKKLRPQTKVFFESLN